MMNKLWCVCLLACIVLAFASCFNQKNLYDNPLDEEDEQQMVEYITLNIHITSLQGEVLCRIYYEYPYNEEGALSSLPRLMAFTPVNTTLQVPSNVEKLYLLTGAGNLSEYAIADLDVTLSETEGENFTDSDKTQ